MGFSLVGLPGLVTPQKEESVSRLIVGQGACRREEETAQSTGEHYFGFSILERLIIVERILHTTSVRSYFIFYEGRIAYIKHNWRHFAVLEAEIN